MAEPISRPPSRPSLTDVSDEDLLIYMGMHAEELDLEDRLLVEEACAELYRRHGRLFYGVLIQAKESQLLARLEGDRAVESVVHATFARACQKAEQYEADRAQVKTWLCNIAKNIVIDRLREHLDRPEINDAEDVYSIETPSEASSVSRLSPQEREAFDEALDQLTDLRRKRLLDYEAIRVDGRAPRGAVQTLADKLGTTPEALRTNRTRALQEMHQFVADRLSADSDE